MPPPGIDPRTVQPVVSLYTDRTIPAHFPALNVPWNKVIIFRTQLQLMYSNVKGIFCATEQLCFVSNHDYRNVLHVSETT
jgi:hypothetical protein